MVTRQYYSYEGKKRTDDDAWSTTACGLEFSISQTIRHGSTDFSADFVSASVRTHYAAPYTDGVTCGLND